MADVLQPLGEAIQAAEQLLVELWRLENEHGQATPSSGELDAGRQGLFMAEPVKLHGAQAGGRDRDVPGAAQPLQHLGNGGQSNVAATARPQPAQAPPPGHPHAPHIKTAPGHPHQAARAIASVQAPGTPPTAAADRPRQGSAAAAPLQWTPGGTTAALASHPSSDRVHSHQVVVDLDDSPPDSARASVDDAAAAKPARAARVDGRAQVAPAGPHATAAQAQGGQGMPPPPMAQHDPQQGPAAQQDRAKAVSFFFHPPSPPPLSPPPLSPPPLSPPQRPTAAAGWSPGQQGKVTVAQLLGNSPRGAPAPTSPRGAPGPTSPRGAPSTLPSGRSVPTPSQDAASGATWPTPFLASALTDCAPSRPRERSPPPSPPPRDAPAATPPRSPTRAPSPLGRATHAEPRPAASAVPQDPQQPSDAPSSSSVGLLLNSTLELNDALGHTAARETAPPLPAHPPLQQQEAAAAAPALPSKRSHPSPSLASLDPLLNTADVTLTAAASTARRQRRNSSGASTLLSISNPSNSGPPSNSSGSNAQAVLASGAAGRELRSLGALAAIAEVDALLQLPPPPSRTLYKLPGGLQRSHTERRAGGRHGSSNRWDLRAGAMHHLAQAPGQQGSHRPTGDDALDRFLRPGKGLLEGANDSYYSPMNGGMAGMRSKSSVVRRPVNSVAAEPGAPAGPGLLGAMESMGGRSSVAGSDGAGGAVVGGAGGKKGVKLWTGNKSKAEVARLAVRVVRALDLGGEERAATAAKLTPFVRVACEKTAFLTTAAVHGPDPVWDDFFVFEVQSPAFAVLKVKLYDKLTCWRPSMLGEFRIPVRNVAENARQCSDPTWHTLVSRKDGSPQGQVLVQLFFTSVRVHRPLSVLCCTWNVGNEAPPEDLSPWLKGVDKQEHDIVAIGVQECTFRVRDLSMRAGTEGEDEQGSQGDPYTISRSFSVGKAPPKPAALTSAMSAGNILSSVGSNVGQGLKKAPDANLMRFLGSARYSPQPAARNEDGATSASSATPIGSAHGRRRSVDDPGRARPSRIRRMSLNENDYSSGAGSDSGSSLTATPQPSASSPRPGMPRTPPHTPSPLRPGGSVPVDLSYMTRQPSPPPPPQLRAPAASLPTPLGPSADAPQPPLLAPLRPPSPPGCSTTTDDEAPRLKAKRSVKFHGAGSSAGPRAAARTATGGPVAEGREASGDEATVASAAPRPAPAPQRSPFANWGNGKFFRRPPQVVRTVTPILLGESASEHELLDTNLTLESSQHATLTDDILNTATLAGAASVRFETPAATLSTPKASGQGTQSAPASPAANRALKRTETDGTTHQGAAAGSRSGNIRDVWEECLKDAMGPEYWMVKSVHMGQMRLVVFVRNDMVAGVSEVVRGSQATGVAGVATNKGGVAVGLKIWDTELCFVNSHLAAHQTKMAQRNQNYRDIVKGIRIDAHGMDLLTGYHHVFFMGDLNYRLDYGVQQLNPTETPLPSDFDALVEDIENKRWSELLAVDQLKKEMREKRAFLGFQEADIKFPPTFKVERRKGFVYKMQRSPAWCDRVLYRSNVPIKQVRPLDYFCAPEISTSDHKPVGAVFSVPTIWKRDERASDNKCSITLVIHHLGARDLFMLRPLLPSAASAAAAASSSMPTPKIIFKGPKTLVADEEVWQSHAVRHTRDPVWYTGATRPAQAVIRSPIFAATKRSEREEAAAAAVVDADASRLRHQTRSAGDGLFSALARKIRPASAASLANDAEPEPHEAHHKAQQPPPKAVPLRLELRRAPLQDLASRRLMVHIVDVGDLVAGASTLARGNLCLNAPAMALMQSASNVTAPVTVTVPLEYNGLAAGFLDVTMSLEVGAQARALTGAVGGSSTLLQRVHSIVGRASSSITGAPMLPLPAPPPPLAP